MTTLPIHHRQVTTALLCLVTSLALFPADVFAGERIQPTAPMAVARRGHTATVLADGRVLIVGGIDGSGPLAAAEVFDPVRKTFTLVGNLVAARYGHTATLLANGRVLIAGGQDASGPVASAEIFDPAAGNGFRLLPVLMGAARAGHTATLRSDGTVLLAGGDAAGTAEIFDPVTESFFTPLLSMSVPRIGHTATPLADDNVFLVGGGNASIELFNAASNSFALWPQGLAQTRAGHSSIPTADGRLLVIGGDQSGSVELFDPVAGSSPLSPSLGTPSPTASPLANNQILVLGPNLSGLFDVTSQQLTSITDTNTERLQLSGHTATELPTANNQILIAGGLDSSNNLLNSATLYNPAQISTDAGDYPPFSWVSIYGSGFLPNETVTNQVEEIVGPDAGTSFAPWGVVADTNGAFTTLWQVFSDELLDTTLKLTAVGQTSGLKAETEFSDSTAIQSVTLNGGASVTVQPGALISALVTEKNTANSAWGSTSWAISTSQPPPANCVNTPNHLGNGTFTESFNITAPATPGTYNAYFVAYSDDSCSTSPSGLFTLANAVVVKLATTTTVASSPNPSTYGASVTFTATVTSSSGTPTGVVTFTDGATTLGTGTLNGSGHATFSISTLSVAGSPHSITAVYAGDTSFLGSSSGARLQSVTPALLTITANNQTKAYGAALPSLTLSYSGFVSAETPASLATQPTVTTTATATSPVAAYPITAAGAVDANYTINYVAGTLTVAPVPLTITADNKTKPYGASVPGLTLSYSGFVNGDTAASLTTPAMVSTTASAASAVGSYAITANGAVDANYTISYVAGSLTVTAVPLKITANNQTKPYGVILPNLTVAYSGFVNGDTATSLTTQPTLSTTATASSAVGSYAINASGAVDNNYVISYVAGTLSVTAVPLTITANDQTKAYGASLPTLTLSYSGFVNGDTAASLTTPATVTTSASASSHVAASPYTITASGAVDTNYVISYLAGSLTVTPVALTITADNQTKVYGAALPTLTVSYVGLVNGDTPANLTTSPVVTTTATAASPVGPYPITVSGAVDPDYTVGYGPSATLTVTSAGLTITANNQSKAYAAALPTLTVSYSGLVNGDTAASLATLPNITTAATISSPVGTYAITASGAVAQNYSISYVAGTLTVNPIDLTITANNASKTYGETVMFSGNEFSAAGLVNGDTVTSVSLTSAGAAGTAGVSGAPYAIVPGGALGNGLANYTISYVNGLLTLIPAKVSAIPTVSDKVYDGNTTATPDFAAGSAAFSGVLNGDHINLAQAAGSTAVFDNRNVGTDKTVTVTNLKITGPDSDNYILSATTATTTANITEATLTLTAVTFTKPYDTTTAASGATPTVTGLKDSDTVTGRAESYTTASAATGKTLTVTAYTVNDGNNGHNYTITLVDNHTGVITPVALTITASDKSKAYGAALPALTVTYSGFVGGETSANLTTQPTVATPATPASAVGTYPITVSGAVDGNYTISYVDGTLTVTSAPLTITADNQIKVYGAALPPLTVSYAGFVNGDTAASLSTPPTVTTTATAASHVAGSPFSITASGAVASNYTIGYVAGSLTVIPAALTITANDQTKAYGEPLPTLTASFSGFVNGDTADSLTTLPLISTTATQASHVSGNPYTITAIGAVDSDYTISYQEGRLTVAPVPLKIVAENKHKDYGAALPTLTVSYEGFTNGDTAASLATQPTLSTTATAASHVGTYPITAANAVDADYIISYQAGTLTVDPVPLKITADDQHKNYGAALPTLTVSYEGFTNGDTAASLATQPTLSTTATTSSHVAGNPYSITAIGAVDSDYIISYQAGTLTVDPVPLKITADDQHKDYGAALPPLTASFAGFVNGETFATLTTQPTLSTTASAASHVAGNPYPITVDGAVDADYTITYVAGTLTIAPVGLTISADNKSKAYGDPLPDLTVGYVGFVNGDTAGSLATQPTLSTTATPASHVSGNPYSITPTGAIDTDYTISYVPGTLTITAVALTITADDQSKVYGTPLPTLTASYSGFVNGDGPADLPTPPALGTTAIVSSPVGTYPISATGAVDDDYLISYVAGTLTISKATTCTIIATSQSPIVFGQNITFTATVKDSSSGSVGAPSGTVIFKDGAVTIGTATLSGSGPTTATCPTLSLSAGSHTITVVYGGDGNFTGSTSSSLTEVVIPSVTINWAPPLAGQPVGNKIKVGQVVPHKVDLVNSAGQSVTSGVTVQLQVQGIQTVNGSSTVFQNVIEDANGVGADGTALGYGLMYLVSGHYQFNLDTGDFSDANTLSENTRYYTSTVTVVDNATSLIVGTSTINLETSTK